MINWEKHGFTEDTEYQGVYTHKSFPFLLYEEKGFLEIYTDGFEYPVSKGIIPATNRKVEMLLKAFCIKK